MIKKYGTSGAILLIFLFYHSVALCGELIGVLPLVNQRFNHQDDWLGHYIPARLTANLRMHEGWRFHHRRVIRLWMHNSDQKAPISSKNTILITGSFQTVHRYGYLKLRVQKTVRTFANQKTFEIRFEKNSLDRQIDQLATEIGSWISTKYVGKPLVEFPSSSNSLTRDLFKFRKQLFDPKTIPEIRAVQNLYEAVNRDGFPEFLPDIAESMILLSRNVEDREQKALLSQVERMLRKEVFRHRENAELRSLLAEAYLLADSAATWIEKTAGEAHAMDPENDLAILMLALAKGLGTVESKELLRKLSAVNPWIWPTTNREKALFQKGVLRDHLKEAWETIQKTNDYTPF